MSLISRLWNFVQYLLMDSQGDLLFYTSIIQGEIDVDSRPTISITWSYEINSYILASLPSGYNSLVTSVTSWLELISLDEHFGLRCNLA